MAQTPKRTALRLPRYTRRKWLRAESKWSYFFDLPSWARADKTCPLHNEPLGSNYDAAVRKVEDVLLPLLDSWRSGGASDMVPEAKAPPGTFNWLVAEFKSDKRFADLEADTRKSYEYGLELRRVEIHREFITAAARWMMALKLRSVLSARMAMRLNSLSLQKKFSIR
jgi:hypothetical protein